MRCQRTEEPIRCSFELVEDGAIAGTPLLLLVACGGEDGNVGAVDFAEVRGFGAIEDAVEVKDEGGGRGGAVQVSCGT